MGCGASAEKPKEACAVDYDNVQPKYQPPGPLPRVFLTISINGSSDHEKLVIELFADEVPKTAENFRCLCTGEMGKCRVGKKNQEKDLCYKGSSFHRIIRKFMFQGGDITNEDGTGGESIYGRRFPDEKLEGEKCSKHCVGAVSMANMGPNTNSSQFFIISEEAPHLAGKHVVFGRVVEGLDIVKKIDKTCGSKDGSPKQSVEIVDCGEIASGERLS